MKLLARTAYTGLLVFTILASPAAGVVELRPNLCPRDVTLQLNVHEYTDTGLVLFWIDNAIANTGKGALHLLWGDTVSTDPDTILAIQRFATFDENIDGPGPEELKYDTVGVFVFDTTEGHDHWHYSGFAEYRILDFVTDSVVRTSPKVGFCLLDYVEHDSAACA